MATIVFKKNLEFVQKIEADLEKLFILVENKMKFSHRVTAQYNKAGEMIYISAISNEKGGVNDFSWELAVKKESLIKKAHALRNEIAKESGLRPADLHFKGVFDLLKEGYKVEDARYIVNQWVSDADQKEIEKNEAFFKTEGWKIWEKGQIKRYYYNQDFYKTGKAWYDAKSNVIVVDFSKIDQHDNWKKAQAEMLFKEEVAQTNLRLIVR